MLTVGAGVHPEVGTSETEGRDVSVTGRRLLVCGEGWPLLALETQYDGDGPSLVLETPYGGSTALAGLVAVADRLAAPLYGGAFEGEVPALGALLLATFDGPGYCPDNTLCTEDALERAVAPETELSDPALLAAVVWNEPAEDAGEYAGGGTLERENVYGEVVPLVETQPYVGKTVVVAQVL
jgi:hypothetical protein